MICAWQEFLNVLPGWLASEADRQRNAVLQELRLRLGQVPELKLGTGSTFLRRTVVSEDLDFIVNTASRYSPWAAATVADGYLTAPGGHRIGICGEGVVREGRMQGIRRVTSVNLRIARDFPGIGAGCGNLRGSVLILGPPGSGKTTLLRDLIRQRALMETVGVVDQRGELFPPQFERQGSMDVLSGCEKPEGIGILLRTMGPSTIGVDEITAEADCDALIRAGWCGVELLATAHARSARDLKCRPVYRSLADSGIFDHILVLDRDKSWREERMGA